jgi:hypothetical protein
LKEEFEAWGGFRGREVGGRKGGIELSNVLSAMSPRLAWAFRSSLDFKKKFRIYLSLHEKHSSARRFGACLVSGRLLRFPDNLYLD